MIATLKFNFFKAVIKINMFIAKLLCWKHSQLLIWDGYLRVRIMRFLSCVCRGSLSTPLSFGKSWKLASLHGTHNTFNCFNGLETKRLVVKTHIHCYVYSQRALRASGLLQPQRALRAKLNKIEDYNEKEERLLRKSDSSLETMKRSDQK